MPASFDRLCCSLQRLDLSGCTLRELPNWLGHATALQTLILARCKGLQALPDSLGQLGRLQLLDVSGCDRLAALPEAISGLTALHSLDISGNGAMHELPEGLSLCTALQRLKMRDAPEYWSCAVQRVLAGLSGSLTSLDCSQIMLLADCSAVARLTLLVQLSLESCWGSGCAARVHV